MSPIPDAKSQSFNIIVIGAGAAGLVSSSIAAHLKARVALIERHKMGGDCLNTGCVPSKALIKTARMVHQFRDHKKYGIKSASFEMDFSDVMKRVHGAIDHIAPNDSIERYTKLGVDCFTGDAKILDAHTVQVGNKVLKARSLILALGASPFVPPIKGLDRIPYLTSENLWDLKALPKRLVILGAGPIGCEMSQAFQRLGSAVTLVEAGPRILPREDLDVATMMTACFQKEGLRLETSTRATEVRSGPDGHQMVCERSGGESVTIPFDALFLAVGRRANTQGVDWGSLGIALNKDGTIKVDSRMRADGKQIYACGDVAGPYQFTHMASHQAWYCAVNSLFSPIKSFAVDYSVVPWVTFTDPEIAQVGHNELSATEAGVPFETTTYSLEELDRAIVESENIGRVKVLTVPGRDKILGANIVGPHAGEILPQFIAAMKHGLGMNKLLGTMQAYPTYAEAGRFVAGNWKKAHAPQSVLGVLKAFHSWRV